MFEVIFINSFDWLVYTLRFWLFFIREKGASNVIAAARTSDRTTYWFSILYTFIKSFCLPLTPSLIPSEPKELA